MDNEIRFPVDEMPKQWYNILPDLPKHLPSPKVPEELREKVKSVEKVFVKANLEQDNSQERYVRVPEEVMDLYKQVGRPMPLRRARHLEKYLKTPARMYFKREDLTPTGSFKINTAIPQAYYATKEGFIGAATGTGAGQWGSAMALAAAMYGLDCVVFMTREAYEWKKDRRALMEMTGAKLYSSPSNITRAGRLAVKQPHAYTMCEEPMEYAIDHEGYCFPQGSFYNFVCLHQTIIGQEVQKQLELVDEKPDMMIGCVGSGSNLPGFINPFMREVINGKLRCKFLAVESEASGSFTKGEYRYEYRNPNYPPLYKVYTAGLEIEASRPFVYAEGLVGTAKNPALSLLVNEGLVDATAYPSDEKTIFEAGKIFWRNEGILAAPESCYAIRAAIDEAIKCKGSGEEKVIVTCISGHGFLDMPGYIAKAL